MVLACCRVYGAVTLCVSLTVHLSFPQIHEEQLFIVTQHESHYTHTHQNSLLVPICKYVNNNFGRAIQNADGLLLAAATEDTMERKWALVPNRLMKIPYSLDYGALPLLPLLCNPKPSWTFNASCITGKPLLTLLLLLILFLLISQVTRESEFLTPSWAKPSAIEVYKLRNTPATRLKCYPHEVAPAEEHEWSALEVTEEFENRTEQALDRIHNNHCLNKQVWRKKPQSSAKQLEHLSPGIWGCICPASGGHAARCKCCCSYSGHCTPAGAPRTSVLCAPRQCYFSIDTTWFWNRYQHHIFCPSEGR